LISNQSPQIFKPARAGKLCRDLFIYFLSLFCRAIVVPLFTTNLSSIGKATNLP
jgi:hypothetical protein